MGRSIFDNQTAFWQVALVGATCMTVFLALGSASDRVVALICATAVPGSYWISRRWPSLGIQVYLSAIVLWTAWHLRQPDAFEYRWDLKALEVYGPITSLMTCAATVFFGWRLGIAFATFCVVVSPLARGVEWGSLCAGLLLMVLLGHLVHSLLKALEQSRSAYSEISRIDALTQIGNRRAFEEDLIQLEAQARASGQLLQLILWDLDNLKEINDRDGHAAGDAQLRRFVAILKAETPQPAYLYRVGGDEFCTLLMQESQPLIERVTEKFVHVSAGSAPVNTQRPEYALEVADLQMYTHKRYKKSLRAAVDPA